MGNSQSRAELDMTTELQKRGYSQFQTLDSSLANLEMAGAQIWKKGHAHAQNDDPLYVLTKEKIASSELLRDTAARSLDVRKQLVEQNPHAESHLGRLLFATSSEDSQFCTSYFKTSVAYEYLPVNLGDKLRRMRDMNQAMSDKFLSQDQLSNILAAISHGSLSLQSVGLHHGDVQPSNVMVDEQSGDVLLFEKPLVMQYYTNFNRMLNDSNYSAALSPEQLRDLKKVRIGLNTPATHHSNAGAVQHYTEKDEVFATGITMLTAAGTRDMGAYYNFRDLSVNRESIDAELNRLMNEPRPENRVLDAGFVELVAQMLDQNPDLRPTMAEIFEQASGDSEVPQLLAVNEDRVFHDRQGLLKEQIKEGRVKTNAPAPLNTQPVQQQHHQSPVRKLSNQSQQPPIQQQQQQQQHQQSPLRKASNQSYQSPVHQSPAHQQPTQDIEVPIYNDGVNNYYIDPTTGQKVIVDSVPQQQPPTVINNAPQQTGFHQPPGGYTTAPQQTGFQQQQPAVITNAPQQTGFHQPQGGYTNAPQQTGFQQPQGGYTNAPQRTGFQRGY